MDWFSLFHSHSKYFLRIISPVKWVNYEPHIRWWYGHLMICLHCISTDFKVLHTRTGCDSGLMPSVPKYHRNQWWPNLLMLICLNGLSVQGHYEVKNYINTQQRALLRRWPIRHRSDTMLLVRCQNDVHDRHLPPCAYWLVVASFPSITFVSVRLAGCSMSLESRVEVLHDDWASVWYPFNLVKSQQPI